MRLQKGTYTLHSWQISDFGKQFERMMEFRAPICFSGQLRHFLEYDWIDIDHFHTVGDNTSIPTFCFSCPWWWWDSLQPERPAPLHRCTVLAAQSPSYAMRQFHHGRHGDIEACRFDMMLWLGWYKGTCSIAIAIQIWRLAYVCPTSMFVFKQFRDPSFFFLLLS